MFDGIENGMEKWGGGRRRAEDAKQFKQVRVGVILW